MSDVFDSDSDLSSEHHHHAQSSKTKLTDNAENLGKKLGHEDNEDFSSEFGQFHPPPRRRRQMSRLSTSESDGKTICIIIVFSII